MREIAMRNYDSLSETETYMWGLGIAGIVHQWERDTRVVITALGENPPNAEKLERMDFEELCKQVAKTGFNIKQHSSFPALRRACLIANTIKLGAGKSFRELAAERIRKKLVADTSAETLLAEEGFPSGRRSGRRGIGPVSGRGVRDGQARHRAVSL